MTESDGQVRRNFRSAYYGKLGFPGNEEKNHLNLLIDLCPLDTEKLKDLCEKPELDRKCIEAWKIFLGVECGRKNPFDEYANVGRVRSEHFQMLKHHLEVLLKHNSKLNVEQQHKSAISSKKTANGLDATDNRENNTEDHNHRSGSSSDDNDGDLASSAPSAKATRANHARLITQMYFLESGRLDTLDIDGQLKTDETRRMLMMATFFVTIADNLQEAFFLFRNFTNYIQTKPKS